MWWPRACSSRNLLRAGVPTGPWQITKPDRRIGRPEPCDPTDPVARLAPILRKPRHLGGFHLAVRTAQWSSWGRNRPEPWGDGSGAGPAGEPAGGEDGVGSAGGVGGTRPDRCPATSWPVVDGVPTAPICAVSAREVRARWTLGAGPAGPFSGEGSARPGGRRGPRGRRAPGPTPTLGVRALPSTPSGCRLVRERATRCRTGRRWSHPAGQPHGGGRPRPPVSGGAAGA